MAKYLSFLEETGCLPLFAGMSSDRTTSPDHSKNRYGSQHSQNTLPTSFLKKWHGGSQECLDTSMKLQGNISLWTWKLRPDAKAILPLWKPDNGLLKSARKTLYLIFLFIKATTMVKYLSSLKEAGCLPLLVGSHLTVEFHQMKVTTGKAVNTALGEC